MKRESEIIRRENEVERRLARNPKCAICGREGLNCDDPDGLIQPNDGGESFYIDDILATFDGVVLCADESGAPICNDCADA